MNTASTPSLPGVAIVGCGLIGNKRATALVPSQLLHVCDAELSRATLLAAKFPNSSAQRTLGPILNDPAVTLVIVATPNVALAPVALECVHAGKHVLIEKPGALNAKELTELLLAANSRNVTVRIGYNHRFHPAFQKARELVDSGVLGPLMFLRSRYGHGGRVGYDKEWRANPELSGGGELIDQGVHLIDLAGWFLGHFSVIDGHTTTSLWDMPVDDNAFLSLRTPLGQTAWLHASCTEWKNMFSFELYGRDGKISIDGLGGSYGVERITWYKMLPEMGPPETTSWEFPRGDQSWSIETQNVLSEIQRPFSGNPELENSVRVLEIVETIYAKSGFPWASQH